MVVVYTTVVVVGGHGGGVRMWLMVWWLSHFRSCQDDAEFRYDDKMILESLTLVSPGQDINMRN